VTRRRLAIPLVLALVVAAGCGDGEETTPSPARSPAAVKVQAGGDEDGRIGAGLKQYIVRMCPPPGTTSAAILEKYRGTPYYPELKRSLATTVAFCESIATIEVEDSRMTVRAGLKTDPRGRAVGEWFCDLVQGSDVADFTPGHELQTLEGETITVCPARTS
jgi:hypothetical protein